MSGWHVGCLVYGVIFVIALMLTGSNDDAFLWLFFLWFGAAVPGITLLIQKKRLGWLSSLGCILWLLLGWEVAIALLALGPIIWAIALFIKPYRKCPECQQTIPGDARRCSHCGAESRPII